MEHRTAARWKQRSCAESAEHLSHTLNRHLEESHAHTRRLNLQRTKPAKHGHSQHVLRDCDRHAQGLQQGQPKKAPGACRSAQEVSADKAQQQNLVFPGACVCVHGLSSLPGVPESPSKTCVIRAQRQVVADDSQSPLWTCQRSVVTLC